MSTSRTRLAVIAGAILVFGVTPGNAEGVLDFDELCRESEWLPASRERSPLTAAYCQVTEDPDPIYLMPIPLRPAEESEAAAPLDSHRAGESEIETAIQLSSRFRIWLWLVSNLR